MSYHFSPLSEARQKALEELSNQITSEQAVWLSGYFQGLSRGLWSQGQKSNASPAQSSTKKIPLTILFGTHTNRSKKIAESIHKKAQARNLDSKVVGMDDYNPRDLKDEKNVLVIVSTHGEGGTTRNG